jgi:TetR/AcrR family transcriptional regulator, regulator of biofilm formation and stress response
MAFRPETHRDATLARRDAVLDAAISLIGERGLGAVTHRAVAAEAGLPLATTSYFFASIDDLLVEAMRRVADKAIADLEATAARVAAEPREPQEAMEEFVAVLLAEPEAATVAQFETYLEAARRPELRPEVERVLDAFEELVRAALDSLDAPAPRNAARAFVALADGFALHRLGARRDEDHAGALRDALLALFAGLALQAENAQRSTARA